MFNLLLGFAFAEQIKKVSNSKYLSVNVTFTGVVWCFTYHSGPPSREVALSGLSSWTRSNIISSASRWSMKLALAPEAINTLRTEDTDEVENLT